MPKLKELALLTYGVTFGAAVFLVSTQLVHGHGFGGFTTWGYPFVWRSVLSASPLFVNYFALAVDFVFWLAISIAVVEGSSHIPYLQRKLKIQRAKRNVTPTSATDYEPTLDNPEMSR